MRIPTPQDDPKRFSRMKKNRDSAAISRVRKKLEKMTYEVEVLAWRQFYDQTASCSVQELDNDTLDLKRREIRSTILSTINAELQKLKPDKEDMEHSKTLLRNAQAGLEEASKRIRELEHESKAERDLLTRRLQKAEDELKALRGAIPFQPPGHGATELVVAEATALSSETQPMNEGEPISWEVTEYDFDMHDSTISSASTISLGDVRGSHAFYLSDDEACDGGEFDST